MCSQCKAILKFYINSSIKSVVGSQPIPNFRMCIIQPIRLDSDLRRAYQSMEYPTRRIGSHEERHPMYFETDDCWFVELVGNTRYSNGIGVGLGSKHRAMVPFGDPSNAVVHYGSDKK